jgi:hypothetical protein
VGSQFSWGQPNPSAFKNRINMILHENNYIEEINGMPKRAWKPLLDLIPEIHQTDDFGEFGGEETSEQSNPILPYSIHGSVVSRFRQIAYDLPIIISFNWGQWEEGRMMVNDESFDFDSIDIPTKCKIITAIVRNDRFCDGALILAFKSGLISKILMSIKNQL